MIIAVCGGIGTGKSVVIKMLQNCGAFTLSADEINKELLTRQEYLEKIESLFPNAFTTGELDKTVIRNEIVADEGKRKALNKLSHGEIISEIIKRSEGKMLVFVEIPLLTEVIDNSFYDKICVVTAPDKKRLKRIVARDNISEEDALRLIELQRSEESLKDKADFVLNNSDSLFDLQKETEAMYIECLIG